MEAHDALLFSIPVRRMKEWIPIIKEEFERPICFANCSLPRRDLIVPCEIETGYNYADLKKFKDIPLIEAPRYEPIIREMTLAERFDVVQLPEDSRLTNVIYESQARKFEI